MAKRPRDIASALALGLGRAAILSLASLERAERLSEDAARGAEIAIEQAESALACVRIARRLAAEHVGHLARYHEAKQSGVLAANIERRERWERKGN